MLSSTQTIPKRGIYLYPCEQFCAEHETAVHRTICEEIAGLLGGHFCGDFRGEPRASPETNVAGYYVPSDTLTRAASQNLHIATEQDFFGGIVPARWMATKALSHPLWNDRAIAPADWNPNFMELAGHVVLRGYTVFSLDDALAAGLHLLEQGPIRLKSCQGKAGKGQRFVDTPMALYVELAAMSESDVHDDGLVVEEHLVDVKTFSVGQINIGGQIASYVGTQGLVADNNGDMVYGGTRLLMTRGDYDALLATRLCPGLGTVISQARCYEQAALAVFNGLLLSRRNYDVAVGVNARGASVSGVLEQSWRIGGASSAEIFGLAELARNPDIATVQAASMELYGADTVPPEGARMIYRGCDDIAGPIIKCVRVACDERAN